MKAQGARVLTLEQLDGLMVRLYGRVNGAFCWLHSAELGTCSPSTLCSCVGMSWRQAGSQ